MAKSRDRRAHTTRKCRVRLNQTRNHFLIGYIFLPTEAVEAGVRLGKSIEHLSTFFPECPWSEGFSQVSFPPALFFILRARFTVWGTTSKATGFTIRVSCIFFYQLCKRRKHASQSRRRSHSGRFLILKKQEEDTESTLRKGAVTLFLITEKSRQDLKDHLPI